MKFTFIALAMFSGSLISCSSDEINSRDHEQIESPAQLDLVSPSPNVEAPAPYSWTAPANIINVSEVSQPPTCNGQCTNGMFDGGGSEVTINNSGDIFAIFPFYFFGANGTTHLTVVYRYYKASTQTWSAVQTLYTKQLYNGYESVSQTAVGFSINNTVYVALQHSRVTNNGFPATTLQAASAKVYRINLATNPPTSASVGTSECTNLDSDGNVHHFVASNFRTQNGRMYLISSCTAPGQISTYDLRVHRIDPATPTTMTGGDVFVASEQATYRMGYAGSPNRKAPWGLVNGSAELTVLYHVPNSANAIWARSVNGNFGTTAFPRQIITLTGVNSNRPDLSLDPAGHALVMKNNTSGVTTYREFNASTLTLGTQATINGTSFGILTPVRGNEGEGHLLLSSGNSQYMWFYAGISASPKFTQILLMNPVISTISTIYLAPTSGVTLFVDMDRWSYPNTKLYRPTDGRWSLAQEYPIPFYPQWMNSSGNTVSADFGRSTGEYGTNCMYRILK